MSAHTKGPWKAVHVGSIGGENPEDVYEVTTEDDRVRICEYVGTADARLIAAAPELLDFARALSHGLRMGYAADELLRDGGSLRARLDAAIRKAAEG